MELVAFRQHCCSHVWSMPSLARGAEKRCLVLWRCSIWRSSVHGGLSCAISSRIVWGGGPAPALQVKCFDVDDAEHAATGEHR